MRRLSQQSSERLVPVDWGTQEASVYPIDIEVIANDRPGLLRDISDALSRAKLNVIAFDTLSRDPLTRMQLTVEYTTSAT